MLMRNHCTTDQEVLGSSPSRRAKKLGNIYVFTKSCYIFFYNSARDTYNNFLKYIKMIKKFEQISIKSSFMKHNGGLLFREISESEFEFKTTIEKNHLNK